MPPRHGKSRMVAVEFPTHLFGLSPKEEVISASYASDLVIKHSREARNRMFSPFYQELFDTRINMSNRNVVDWYTTAGGHYRAVTMEGQVTGFGATVLIVDDPYRDYAEAHSETMRERVWQWFLSTAFSRLAPNGVIIIMMTRWHVDDLVGRLLDPKRVEELEDAGAQEEKWTVLNFPAIALEEDVLGRKPGDALFPEKFDKAALKSIRAVQGSYKWSALYEGNPVPRGGNYINSDNFVMKRRDEIPEGIRWVRFWDLATSEKEKDDFTVGIKAGFDKEGCMWLDSMVEFQKAWPEARDTIVKIAKEEIKQVKVVGIEAVGGFRTAARNLAELFPSTIELREWKVDKDKLTRALPWIAMTQNKKVNLLYGPWCGRLKSQCDAFPAGKNDDIIDAITGCFEMVHAMPMFIPVTIEKAQTAIASRRNRSMSGL